MTTTTNRLTLDQPLSLLDDQGNAVSLTVMAIQMTREAQQITACTAEFQLSREQLHQIESRSLFNLDPEIRSPLSAGPFQAELPLRLQASLDPEFLECFPSLGNPEQLGAHLKNLSEQDPLLSADHWYGLRISQQQENGETGYTSLWAYLDPSLLGVDPLPTQALSEAMAAFSQACQGRSTSDSEAEDPFLETADQDESVAQMTQTIESLLGRFTQEVTGSLSDVADQIAASFSGALESLDTVTGQDLSQELLQILIAFFQEEEWFYQQVGLEPMLLTLFQGDHGRWECYAECRETEQQVLFYSICPLVCPVERRTEVAEFLGRANWGLVIGNFELDWDQGQIRCKTSLDVEGDRLSIPLVRNLAYSNVLIMDTYLPGLKAVIEDGVAPEVAIRSIEQE